MAKLKFRKCVSWNDGYRMVYSDQEEYKCFFTYETHSQAIMQFSGITDSKNNEVYDSDILKIENELYIAFWDDWNARFLLEKVKGREKFDNFREMVKKGEVVGNLGENEELLK